MAFVLISEADLSEFICRILKQIEGGVEQAIKAGIMCFIPRTVHFDLSISTEDGPVGQVKFVIPLMPEVHNQMKERLNEA